MCNRTTIKTFLRRHVLILLILAGASVGFAVGFGVRMLGPKDDVIMWIGLPGEIFMNLIKMIILPLIASSIISGIASSEYQSKGRLGLVTFWLYFLWNTLGVITGYAVFYVFSPGTDSVNMEGKIEQWETNKISTSDIFADMIRNIFPDNVIAVSFRKVQTMYVLSTSSKNATDISYKRAVSFVNNANILGAVVVSIFIGMAAEKTEGAKKFFVPFFKTTMDILICMMKWFIWVTPIGVASFIAVSLLRLDNLQSQFHGLGMYMSAFLVGTVVQQAVCLPLFHLFFLKKNPLHFLKSLAQPWITVFGPPSTVIGLPVMIHVTESTLKIRSVVTRFVIPLGTNIGRNGSSMFITLSSLYVAYSSGIIISPSNVVMIGVLSTVGSLAIPSVPSASLITILIILKSLDVPYHGIGMIIAIDWFSDRVRTTTNATYIILTTVLASHFCDQKHHHNDRDSCEEESIHLNCENGTECNENSKI